MVELILSHEKQINFISKATHRFLAEAEDFDREDREDLDREDLDRVDLLPEEDLEEDLEEELPPLPPLPIRASIRSSSSRSKMKTNIDSRRTATE